MRAAWDEFEAVMDGKFTHRPGCGPTDDGCHCGLDGLKRYLGL